MLSLTNTSDPFFRAASVDFDESLVLPVHLALVALAPKTPSLRDFKTAGRVLTKEQLRTIIAEKRALRR